MHYLVQQLYLFLKKQASSAIFGGVLLFFIVLTKYIHIPGVERYDFLFFIAIATQVLLVLFKLEKLREVGIILIFHVLAMVMEIYKVSIGSWAYPEQGIFVIMNVPMYTGFMYSAIGSYMVRAWRINEFNFTNMPSNKYLLFLGALIYVNFFTNHFIVDIRYLIFALAVVIFWRTRLYVNITDRIIRMHPLISNALLAFVIWMSEQVGTFARTWVYPDQALGWKPVSFHMYVSWYLLLIFSFNIVAILRSKDRAW